MKKTLLQTFLIITLSILLTPNNTFSQYTKMLIGDNNNGQIVVSNINGSLLDTIDLNGTYQSYYDADIDQINKKIYLAWYYGIYSMNYDGSNFDTIIDYPLGGYSDGVAVDAKNGYLYWGSTQESKIFRSDLSGNNIITLYNTLGYVNDVDLDLSNGKIYFGQWFTSNKGLFSIDINGNNLDTIVQNYDVEFIGLDTLNNKIYFSHDATSRRINYDGSNDTLIYNFQSGGFFIDNNSSLLYTSDMTNNNIKVSNLNGGNSSDIFAGSILQSPHGPVLYDENFGAGINTQVLSDKKILVYPNSTNDFIKVKNGKDFIGEKYEITDQLGKLLLVGTLEIENQLIDLSKLNSGMYLLKIGCQNKQTINIIKN